MKESIAKTKTCPHLFAAVTIAASNAVTNGASQEAVKELMTKGRCHGSGCVMWEPEYKEERKEVATSDPEPEGDEWHKLERVSGQRSTTWLRYVQIDEGDCGLLSKESGCFASCQ